MTINPERREVLRDLVRDCLEAQIALWDAHRAIEAELDVDLNGLDQAISDAAVCWDSGNPVLDELLDGVFEGCEPVEATASALAVPDGEQGDCFREDSHA